MKKFKTILLVLLFLFFGVASAQAATVTLYEWTFNIDGAITGSLLGDPFPPGVNAAGFNVVTGLGNISFTDTDNVGGSHYVGLFLNHDFQDQGNPYSNETGSSFGSPAAGQSWEIDEPEFVFGNIWTNLGLQALDNSIFDGNPNLADDVSMAMAWDFILGAGQTATISFLVSQTAPADGFYLKQTDPDGSIYFSSTLNITGNGGPEPVPEPATMMLLGTGLVGLFGLGRKKFMKKL